MKRLLTKKVSWFAMACAILMLWMPDTHAQDQAGKSTYLDVAIDELQIVEGELPAWGTNPEWSETFWTRRAHLYPSVVLDEPTGGEAYVMLGEGDMWNRPFGNQSSVHLTFRVPEETGRVSGRLYLADSNYLKLTWVRFEYDISEDANSDDQAPEVEAILDDRILFYQAKFVHYDHKRRGNIPGGAWFRHQADDARKQLERLDAEPTDIVSLNGFYRDSSLEDTYALFSGGRAVSENLQLDRALPDSNSMKEPTQPIKSIEGITVHEFDWETLVEGLTPEKDPLATLIPADQHAVFFPSFDAMVHVMEMIDVHGTLLGQAMQPGAEDDRVQERYEQQLALPLDELSRLIGSRLVRSIAVTGSDPYLRTGTDVAMLFESNNVEGLMAAIGMRYEAAERVPDATTIQDEMNGVSYRGVCTPDRSICTYAAALGSMVVVTNSLEQLERITEVHLGRAPSLDELDEYIFFRDRYQRDGSVDEAALMVLSDAAIRRWCGPEWRIATSRRTRAAAALAELEAKHIDLMVRGDITPGPVYVGEAYEFLGDVRLTSNGVHSSIYGTLAFQTPIRELKIEFATSEEVNLYTSWRDSYERNWRNAFDPIAVQIVMNEAQLGLDMTVMPLVADTDYGMFVDFSQGAVISSQAGDPHPGALLHWILAINQQSQPFQQMSNGARMFAPQMDIDFLAWMGDAVAVYIEDDPIWNEMANADDPQEFLEQHAPRFPVAIHFEVRDGVRLTAFLAAVRNYIDAVVPQMTVWEPRQHGKRAYVAVSPSEEAKSGTPWDDLTLFYAANSDALILTLQEDLLHRALDRQQKRVERRAADEPMARDTPPWLGESMCVQVERGVIPFIEGMMNDSYQLQMQAMAWGNLPILNEWKSRFPDADPMDVQFAFAKTRLACPGGGTYTWNEAWQTMESTIFGHPGEPRDGAKWPPALREFSFMNAGLTFENDGLRARVEMLREGIEE